MKKALRTAIQKPNHLLTNLAHLTVIVVGWSWLADRAEREMFEREVQEVSAIVREMERQRAAA